MKAGAKPGARRHVHNYAIIAKGHVRIGCVNIAATLGMPTDVVAVPGSLEELLCSVRSSACAEMWTVIACAGEDPAVREARARQKEPSFTCSA